MSEQIKIMIRSGEKNVQYELLHDTEKTLLETMREGAVLLPSLCGGIGKCGRCVVRFHEHAPFPTQTDRKLITPEQLRAGYRLACMARPRRECVVEADFAGEKAAEEESLHVLTGYYAAGGESQTEKPPAKKKQAEEQRAEERQTEEQRAEESFCETKDLAGSRTLAAADIGTTTVAMQLLEICSGRILDTYTCLNPQRSYGQDVISRIKAANEGHGKTLQKLIEDVLMTGMEQLKQSAQRQGLREPELLSIACNTVMGHIFMGYSTETLGKSPFLPINIKTTAIQWNGMETVLMPGISAFVGGDIVAGLYACRLYSSAFGKNSKENREADAWLFMDLGTNAEMVMGCGCRVAATAAAAGPAFEGMGRHKAKGPMRIRAVADLLERGIVDETGLLKEPYFETGIKVMLKKDNNEVTLTQEDIRELQMAKAAVRAGIYFLMKKLGIEDYGRIKKLYIAGGMGFYLDLEAAVRIGLLPDKLAEVAQTAGNTALAGAGLFGRGEWRERGRELEVCADDTEVFQLAELEEFQEVYIRYMNFHSYEKPEK